MAEASVNSWLRQSDEELGELFSSLDLSLLHLHDDDNDDDDDKRSYFVSHRSEEPNKRQSLTDKHLVSGSRMYAHHIKCDNPEETVNSFTRRNGICYTDVIVVGNGPSGITMSYFLSGHWPYYTGVSHPNELLQLRLDNIPTDVSLIEQDLDYLSDGLEGRSSNPLAILFDALTHPEADTGIEVKSLLHWEHHKDKVIPHVVLGRRAEGGTWQTLNSDVQTLSLGSWMELPDLSIKDWLAEYRSMKQELQDGYLPPPVQNRTSMTEVCAYYTNYVQKKGLSCYMQNYSTVTSVERVLDVSHAVDDESGEQNPCSNDHRGKVKWEVRGYQVITNEHGEEETVDFCYRAPNVVLATGSYDVPNKLCVPGENLPYVLHSLAELEAVVKCGQLTAHSDPVLVVGAGLSAADAILFAENSNIPVIHVFRREVDDPKIVLRQLPANLYPEYHHVLQMMKENDIDEGYKAYPQHQLIQCLEDGKVLIRGPHIGCDSLIQVSYVIVMIGSRPDLSFLPQDGKNLGIYPGLSIDSKNNPIHIDPLSYQSVQESGLFALGPLVGDNFVRFLRGGALGVTSYLWRKRNELKK